MRQSKMVDHAGICRCTPGFGGNDGDYRDTVGYALEYFGLCCDKLGYAGICLKKSAHTQLGLVSRGREFCTISLPFSSDPEAAFFRQRGSAFVPDPHHLILSALMHIRLTKGPPGHKKQRCFAPFTPGTKVLCTKRPTKVLRTVCSSVLLTLKKVLCTICTMPPGSYLLAPEAVMVKEIQT